MVDGRWVYSVGMGSGCWVGIVSAMARRSRSCAAPRMLITAAFGGVPLVAARSSSHASNSSGMRQLTRAVGLLYLAACRAPGSAPARRLGGVESVGWVVMGCVCFVFGSGG